MCISVCDGPVRTTRCGQYMPITAEDLLATPPRGTKRPTPSYMEDEDMVPAWEEDMVKRILGATVPSIVMKSLQQIIREFSDKIEKLQRARLREQKQTTDLSTLSSGQYPAGVRPFSPGTEAELDSPFADSRHQDAHVNIVIPKGSTRKQALSIIHLQTAAFYKKVDLEVTKEYVSTLQASTAFDHFMEVASQPEDAQVQALNQLGLSLPPGLNSNPNVSKEKALELYLAMVNKAAAKKVAQDKLAAKTAKEKEQLRDAIRAKDPKNLFESAVKQAMMDMSKQVVDPRVDYAQALASNENPINHIDWTKEAPSKRRFTKSELAQRKQAKAKGANNTKEHAHKGKGKGKDAPKGKGKGQEVPAKGKGKSKGGGKPSHKGEPKGKGKGKHYQQTPQHGKQHHQQQWQQQPVFHNVGATADKPKRGKGGETGGRPSRQ